MLSRTRTKARIFLKGLVFDKAHIQEAVDARRRSELERAMGFAGQWDEHRRFQMDLLKRQGLLPQHRLLEIGCGPLTAGIPIIGHLQPNNYVGIDVRSSVLDLSWSEVGLAELAVKNPRLICSSTFGAAELRDDDLFDFILSFSVLYHLSDVLLEQFFRTVSVRLAPGGRCLVNVNTTLESSRWLEFPFLKRTVEDYRLLAEASDLSTTDIGPMEVNGFKLSGDERENHLLIFEKI